ncbi:UDP-N-acetylglucosamine 1-carboxyvinyltransferase [Anaerosinus massiliensis]|uniref:UDP-N-acetylglucosamine 1-carboxyvinyltransferase n=1 Tax=Massilibacillus massiliensis TaxID=1806837 RepID=UPI000A6BBA34|nr:UDP-N-acetylglucosamine 1-carboxyvinyltransferase [Massilibacillus massiliensis]
MDKFIVTGEVHLKGSVRVSGAKNAALPILAATMLCSGTSIIHDVPDLSDIKNMVAILELLGAKVSREGNSLVVDSSAVSEVFIPELLMREMRASIFLMGALIGRFKEVRLSYPGGCTIGPRPIDLHIKALEKLGANVTEKHGLIIAEAKRLAGAEIVLDFPSVGATENAMMSAVLAEGITTIRNAAREPEIIDLETFLNKMGARICGAGTDTILIHGVQKLYATEHTVIPDRIEAGTFILAGAISRGEVTVTNVPTNCLFSLLDKLSGIGAILTVGNDFIRVKADQLYNTDIKTLPFPGFPTDLQAPMLAVLTIAKGTSIVTETIFENRFQHVDQLIRMGAKIRVEGRSAIVRGVNKLTGTLVEALDLRAGASLVLAALAAEGTSVIKQVNHIDRGYETIEKKLQSLGACIIRDME